MTNAPPDRENIAVDQSPKISMILPFEPLMFSKSDLENRLERVVQLVKATLLSRYARENALPLVFRIQKLFQNLNYFTHKKSIAAFVSPFCEKVDYISFAVEEKILVDGNFKIRDILLCKKHSVQFLVLLFDSNGSSVYLGDPEKVSLIKKNAMQQDLHDVRHFLYGMDKDLSLVLRGYDLPVFVTGTQEMLDFFSQITTNKASIVSWIPLKHSPSEQTIRSKLMPYLQRWETIRGQQLLQQVEIARRKRRLVSGVTKVIEAAQFEKNRLLLVENNFSYPIGGLTGEKDKTVITGSKAFYIGDAVDEIIEKVLETGNEAEMVPDDSLKRYNRIALIQGE